MKENNSCSKTSLKTARYMLLKGAKYGDEELVSIALDSGVNIETRDEDGRTALMLAAGKHTRITKLLVDAGADINAKDIIGGAPIIFAADGGNIENIKLLLSKGANVNVIDKDGYHALCCAIYNRHYDVVKVLIESGIDINKIRGNSLPFFEAIAESHPEIIRLFLDSGVDIHKTNKKGNTAPMQVILYWDGANSQDLLNNLIKRGVDLTVCNNEGQTVLDLAQERESVVPGMSWAINCIKHVLAKQQEQRESIFENPILL